ncbi:hypothetical protein KR074_003848, partial [Drosophila pseudoananassae]
KMFSLLYGILETISGAIYTVVATVWHIQQAVTNLMMSSFLFVLGLVCHPIMVVPMLCGGYYFIRNYYSYRSKIQRVEETSENDGFRYMSRTPRLRKFRNMGNATSRSEGN